MTAGHTSSSAFFLLPPSSYPSLTRPCIALLCAATLLVWALGGGAATPSPTAHLPLAQFATAERPRDPADAARRMQASLLGALGGEASARHCSGYLAPADPHEWAAGCDAACVQDELHAFAWNFGAKRIVDLTEGYGGAFSAAAGTASNALSAADLLHKGEAPGSVGLAVLAQRALAELAGEPAVFLLPTQGSRSRLGVGGDARGAAPAWVAELGSLPPALRGAIKEAFTEGHDALVAGLNTPAAVLAALQPALSASRDPKRSSTLLLLPSGGTAGSVDASLGPSTSLSAFRALVCLMLPNWSVEVQSGHLRVYAPLRSYIVPPRQIPPALWAEITESGALPVRSTYWNQASLPGGEPVTVNYGNGTISVLLWKAGRREQEYYGVTDIWLYALLDRHRELVAGRRVAILGSLEPWYECIALTYGAQRIFTVEYGARRSDDPRFEFITPSAMEAAVAAGTWEPFDLAFSISSFEHDGLGRYGDPLNGAGDLGTMAFVRSKVLKPGGHLIFAVPMGRDCVNFNEQRVYGQGRMAKMLAGWKVIDVEGLDWDRANGYGQCDQWYQPVYLLQAESQNKLL